MATDIRAMRSGLRGGFFTVCQWITRFAVANLLWAGLALLGLGIVGFFPATVAMFEVIRRWLLADRDADVPVRSIAWRSFRSHLWAANAVGYLLASVAYLLYLDVRLFANSDSLIGRFMLVLSLAAASVFALTVIYLGPVVVHIELKWYEQFRLAAAIGISHPFSALYLVLTGSGLYFVCWQVPGLVVFFGGSVLATLAMWQLMSITSRRRSELAGR
ncbi:MAG TPA: DUF624 domain-containing protein [Mycobacteriales bacterium]|nr:DUF624 domain-containing protein [Mycobacteriales bacterium]